MHHGCRRRLSGRLDKHPPQFRANNRQQFIGGIAAILTNRVQNLIDVWQSRQNTLNLSERTGPTYC